MRLTTSLSLVVLLGCGDDGDKALDTNDGTADVDVAPDTGADSVAPDTHEDSDATDIGPETVDAPDTSETTVDTTDDIADTSDDIADTPETTDTTDTTDTIDPGDPALRFALAGSIEIIEQYSDGAGSVVSSWIYVDLADRPDPMLYTLEASDGVCKVWSRLETACDPPCDFDEICGSDSRCSAQPAPVSAGDIAFTGLAIPITAEASAGGFYTLEPDPPLNGLFTPGAAIGVTAAGDAVPAFSVALTGVADMHFQGVGLVELADDQPTTLSWTPAADGSYVEVTLQLGWHGAPPSGVIACRAPDSAGEITITPAIITRFPYFGGIGLFQVPSWLERLSRAVVATPYGPIAITVSSRVNLGVTHL